MNLAIPRVVLPAACLAILMADSSNAAPPAPRFNVRVMVLDCYRGSDFRISIDGRPLALTPPSRREDSIGLCYNEPAALGAQARIQIQAGGQNREVVVRPDAQSRYLLINPVRIPNAEFTRTGPLLD